MTIAPHIQGTPSSTSAYQQILPAVKDMAITGVKGLGTLAYDSIVAMIAGSAAKRAFSGTSGHLSIGNDILDPVPVWYSQSDIQYQLNQLVPLVNSAKYSPSISVAMDAFQA